MTTHHDIKITGHHFEPTEAIRHYIEDKIERIEKWTPDIINIHVTLLTEKKIFHKVTIHYFFSHFELFVEAVSDDMYKSIDTAIDRLARKIARWKGQIQNHQSKKDLEEEASFALLNRIYDSERDELLEFNEEIESSEKQMLEKTYPEPKIVSRVKKSIKTLSLTEALMKLDCMSSPFLLFRGEEDRKMKILYRQPNFSIALIEFDEKH